jgi:hypothetical protein
MELKSGQKLYSAVCDGQFVVVRAPSGPVDVSCGGAPVLEAAGEERATIDAAHAEGVLVGKRYVDEASGIELLCSKAGVGSLTVDGRAVELKGAKPLPSSD